MKEPFARVAMDVFGPLSRTKTGNKYILVLMNYCTKWPEAFALRNVTTETVVNCLVEVTAQIGVPEDLLSDNGSNFISNVMQQYCKVMGLKQIRTSPYHPQTDGKVEKFNSTLKRLLRKLTQDPKVEWHCCLPYVLWAYRVTVHKTTGFSPYHLLFGKEMGMPLDQMVRNWKGKETNDETGVVEFIQTLKANMEAVRNLAYERESEEKEKQKHYLDLTAKDRVFAVGDFVLVFRPGKQDKLQNQWQDSFPITKKVTDVSYKIDLETKIKRYTIFHVNCTRQWTSPASAVFLAQDTDEEDLEIVEEERYTHIMQDSHHIDIEELKKKYKDVLQDVPGRTTFVQHDILTGDSVPIR